MTTKLNKTRKTLEKIQTITGEKLTLGKLLWSIRMGEEETQVEFAEKLNISKQYLCDIEKGRRFISPKAAAEYAKTLGYSESQFVRLCLQDSIDRDGLDFIIEIKAA